MVKYVFIRTLNPISKNRDFLAKILGRQIRNIGVYRRTKPQKAEKKGIQTIPKQRHYLLIPWLRRDDVEKKRFTKIEHSV
jgi:hypothetical protein